MVSCVDTLTTQKCFEKFSEICHLLICCFIPPKGKYTKIAFVLFLNRTYAEDLIGLTCYDCFKENVALLFTLDI